MHSLTSAACVTVVATTLPGVSVILDRRHRVLYVERALAPLHRLHAVRDTLAAAGVAQPPEEDVAACLCGRIITEATLARAPLTG